MINFPPANYVRRIEIDDLFGERKEIRIARDSSSDPRVFVLYGRNGSGKTTILKILNSLISAEDNAGHRTRLAKIPFTRASVHLDGGTVIEAKKKDGMLGAYDWSIKRPNSAESFHLNLRPRRGRIAAEDWDLTQQQRYSQMTRELQSLNNGVIFLDDRRTFTRELDYRKNRNSRIHLIESDFSTEDVEDIETDPVYVGLKAVANSIRREAILLSNRGNQNAQSIYTTLVKGISSFPEIEPNSSDDLRERLKELENSSRVLSLYGLGSVAEHSELLNALDQANDKNLPLVRAVLNPYVESLSARLLEIGKLHKQIDSWINNINKFIAPKYLSFRVGEGFEIKNGSGFPIPASVMSSGERHLLVLMTRAILMRTLGGILIIDEPELSLNSDWQRSLIRSLLEGFGGGPCQLFVASHSLEICSQYQNEVVII
ncbi:AAA family ATPase [Xanthomonas euvesicatoria]|uniref:Energy-coupling factor transporter ATP-binding protein EcfA2 n=1 Tax=Xanthomonas euvesicatoria TaxID=456327 RepID=A0AAW3UAU0_XANEU|nr:AAA family ATPase [Xanthomonas euvesicatoria]MBB4725779.1 energy-coupling factor transporter ATP-binding protein EcfA2 [Xanthomonas euvesicatoria]MBB4872323.1 energy-coupling factor transporter ATP-binding protein EcfA2 [Xanthomonas euvesicatoria]